MGLYVTAYRNIKTVEHVALDEDGCPIDDGIVRLLKYDFEERSEDMQEGFYTYDDSYGFDVGPCSGYDRWRLKLALLAGFKSDSDACDQDSGPFWELINFSDCEGVLGTSVCKKLLKDFKEYYERASYFDDEYFFDKYKHWMCGMEFAADNGFFVFS